MPKIIAEKLMNKKLLINGFLISLFLIPVVSYASGKSDKNDKNQGSKSVPEWIFDVKTSFPLSKYIAFTGDGSSKNEAEAKALSLLASYFKSDVSSNRTTTTGMKESSSGGVKSYSSEKDFESEINVEAEINLYGVDYAYYFSEKENLWYCCAYMDREKSWKMIEAELQTILHQANENTSNAKNSSDVFTTIRLYAKNRKVYSDFREKMYFAQVIDFEKSKNYSVIESIYMDSEKQILALHDKGSIKLELLTDDAKAIEKNVGAVLENEGFFITSSKAFYHAKVDASFDITQQGEWFVSYPKISVEIFDSTSKTVYSYSKTSGRVVGIDERQAKIKAVNKSDELLSEMFD